ncbi:MAG: hypothetical protein FJX67_06495 [Alphaproteobacteria bacterium]|nr:hypothetical protein [Alphaproteobacteria bacterium]
MSLAPMPPVWPPRQSIGTIGHAAFPWTLFDDTAAYHPALIAACLARTAATGVGLPGSGGAKAYDLERWNVPAATLLTERACAFVRKGYSRDTRLVGSWANVTASGEYGQPHSHTRSTVSVVYFLDLGTNEPTNPHNGRFAFVDPRLTLCCHEEAGRLSQAVMPQHVDGLMFGFPSQIVHFVHVYRGERPRISIAWNFALATAAGL